MRNAVAAFDPISGGAYVLTTTVYGAALSRFNQDGRLLAKTSFPAIQSGNALYVDRTGQVYIAGQARSTFATTPNAFQTGLPTNASFGGFVIKLATNGSTVFSTFVGKEITALTVDSNGRVMACGYADPNSLLDATANAFQRIAAKTSYPGFCLKLSADGTSASALTYVGAPDDSLGSNPIAVAADSEGNFVVAGNTTSRRFPIVKGFQPDYRRTLFRVAIAAGSEAWNTIDDGTMDGIYGIDFDRQNPGRVFMGTLNGVNLSEDGGKTWRSILASTQKLSISVHPKDARYLVATAPLDSGGLFQVSSDAGAHWRQITSSITDPRVIVRADAAIPDSSKAGIFYLRDLLSNNVFLADLSTNRTSTIVSGTPGVRLRSLSVAQTADGSTVIYVLNSTGARRSLDGGTTFSPLQTNGTVGTELTSLIAAPSDANVLYAGQLARTASDARFIRSNDGGLTWTELPSPPIGRGMIVDPTVPSTLYVYGGIGGIQRSRDSGLTWATVSNGLNNRDVMSLAKDPNGVLWAGSELGTNTYVMRISGDATNLLSSVIFSGAESTRLGAMTLNSSGEILLTGSTSSADLPLENVGGTKAASPSGFLLRLSAEGSTVKLAERLDAGPNLIAFDSRGRVQLAGFTYTSDLPTPGSQQSNYQGAADGFWIVLDSTGRAIVHATYLGGTSFDSIYGMVPLTNNTTFLATVTDSRNFPTTGDAVPDTLGPSIFVTLASTDGPLAEPSSIIPIPSGGAAVLSKSGRTDVLATGYATVGLNTGSPPYGTAVFKLKQNGVTVSEAGVPDSPPTTTGRLFIDFRPSVAAGQGTVGVNTGLALANTGALEATITLTLRDITGAMLTTGKATLPAKQQVAKFVDQLAEICEGFVFPNDFGTNRKYGVLEFSSNQAVSVVALRLTVNQRGETLFTSTPVASGTSVSGPPIYFPHFADGGGYTTSIVLLSRYSGNPNGSVTTGMFTFMDSSGQPVSVTLTNGASGSSFPFSVPAGGAAVFETTGERSTIKSGWISAGSSGEALAGAVVFRFIQNGVVVTETGVPAGTSSDQFRTYVDTADGHGSGIAIANPYDSPITLTFTPMNLDGTAKGSAVTKTLGPYGQMAQFVEQMIPSWKIGDRGVLQIVARSSGQLFFAPQVPALALRSLTNERGEFLLTTLPIAPANRVASSPLVFPQIATGAGYTTEIILIGGGAGSVPVLFFSNLGGPLPQ